MIAANSKNIFNPYYTLKDAFGNKIILDNSKLSN